MRETTPSFEPFSEAEILRQAEILRAEAIQSFFAGLFGKRGTVEPAFPAHIAPAE